MDYSLRAARALRVLVIDGDERAADRLTLLTQLWGYSSRAAYDPVSGLSLFEVHRPDVVIVAAMRGCLVQAMAREMRARRGGERAILIAHGNARNGRRRAALEAGFDQYIARPLDAGRLEDSLAGIREYTWLLANILTAANKRPVRTSPRRDTAIPQSISIPEKSCYLLLKDDGSADTIELGGDRCLCLFTDPRLLQPFYVSRYGDDFASREVGTLSFDGPEKLRAFLRANESGFLKQSIRHLAVNPAPRSSIARVPLRAFIAATDPPRPEDQKWIV